MHGVTIEEGETVELQCAVEGPKNFQVLWFKGDERVAEDKRHQIKNLPDGTQKLIISDAIFEDAAEYRCEAKAGSGSASTSGNLEVNFAEVFEEIIEKAPEFIKELRPISAAVGETIELECVVEGKNYQIQWFKGDEKLVEDDRHLIQKLSDGTQKLVIKIASPDDVANYRCEAKNFGGTAATRAPLDVKGFPSFIFSAFCIFVLTFFLF